MTASDPKRTFGLVTSGAQFFARRKSASQVYGTRHLKLSEDWPTCRMAHRRKSSCEGGHRLAQMPFHRLFVFRHSVSLTVILSRAVSMVIGGI
jgi:hypothetical protein